MFRLQKKILLVLTNTPPKSVKIRGGSMSEDAKKVTVGSKKFTAVDLITVVVFAALVRVLWIVFKTAGVIFPFNHSFIHFFNSFCLVAVMAVVKKKRTSFYYTVGWCAINFFLQGEHWSYWALIILAPLVPELYMNMRSKAFENPDDVFHSFKDLLVCAYVYTVVYFAFVWWSLIYVFLVPIDVTLSILAFIGALILVVPGTWFGYKLGKKINTLIG